MCFPLFVGVLCLSLFCYALLCVHSSFANILKRKRKLVALLLLSYRCIVTINVLWLFLTVPRVGLQCVIVVFPDHTHFLKSIDLNSFEADDRPILYSLLSIIIGRQDETVTVCSEFNDRNFSALVNRFQAKIHCTNILKKLYAAQN